MNRHCLTANKRQVCTSCKKETKHCECAKQMKLVPCEECEEPYTKCKCGLKKDLNVEEVLEKILKEYEDDEEVNMIEIKSISQLTALMAGTGLDGHCTYDPKKKKWIPGRFIPSPKGDFDWENLERVRLNSY